MLFPVPHPVHAAILTLKELYGFLHPFIVAEPVCSLLPRAEARLPSDITSAHGKGFDGAVWHPNTNASCNHDHSNHNFFH